jgi:hypothetical protein
VPRWGHGCPGLLHPNPAGYQFHAGDDRPPADPHYTANIRLGREGKLAEARADLERLAAEHPRTSEAAWSLYQAGLAAQSLKDEAGKRQDWDRLQKEYAEHPLAIRTRETAARAVTTSRPARTAALARWRTFWKPPENPPI